MTHAKENQREFRKALDKHLTSIEELCADYYIAEAQRLNDELRQLEDEEKSITGSQLSNAEQENRRGEIKVRKANLEAQITGLSETLLQTFCEKSSDNILKYVMNIRRLADEYDQRDKIRRKIFNRSTSPDTSV